MQIEHNIPIPPPKKRGNVASILRSMNVGDSVVIPKDKTASWRSRSRICNCKIAVRFISNEEARVWRVE